MVRRWVVQSVVGLSALGIAACNNFPDSGGKTATPSAPAQKPAPVDPGSPLYKGDPAPKIDIAGAVEEQIVVPNAVIRLDVKQTVPAQVDGYINIIASPLPPGTPFDPADPDITMVVDLQNNKVPYRRVREGNRVAKGQIVCLLDDMEVLVQIEASQQIIVKSKEAIKEANKGAGFIREQIDRMKRLGDAGSAVELLNAQATLSRYDENTIQSEREMVKAMGEEKRGWTLRDKHRPKSAVNGIITKIIRSPGEYARAGEPILEILSTDEMIVEGNLDAKDADAVLPGMKVIVEPAMQTGPDAKIGSANHRLEVTGIAVTAHPGQPLIVSSSADGTVGVWNAMPADGKPRTQTRLVHPTGVRSVACTSARTGKHLIASGGDDGKLRIWDVTTPDKIAAEPVKTCDDVHPTAITAVAFSPDGKYLATSAGRDVWVWDVRDLAAAKKLYALPAEHKDNVTAVRFTPQATLVTVARDKAIRVWTVGEKGAAVARTFDHRKGNVDTLGISRDGGRVLFDQDDGRIDVVALADGRTVGAVQNAATAARFGTFAVFSPDDASSLVLTAAADGEGRGELQLWTAPASGRASERRRLVTPYRAAPTCAAFSPDADKRFVAVGTQTGGVYVWTKAAADATKEQVGQVSSRLRLDRNTVKVSVRTEAPAGDTGNLLLDKGSATIIIKPGEMMAPKPAAGNALAPAAGVVPAGGPLPAIGGVVPASGITVMPVVNPPTPATALPNVSAPSPSITAPMNVVPPPEKK